MLNRKLAGGALQAPEKPGRDPDSDKSVPKLPSKPPSLMLATETPQLPLSEIKSVGLSLSAPSPKPQQAIVKDVSTDSPRNSDVSRRVSQSMIPVPSQGSHTDIKAPATEVIVKRIERNPNSRRSEVFESNPNKSGGPTIQRIERRSTVQHQAGQVKVVTVNDGSGGGTGAPHTKLQEEKQDTVNSMDSAGNRVRFDMNESSETAPKAPQGKSVTGERPSGILRRPADVDMVQSPIIEEREEGSKNAEKKYVAMSVIAKPADISESTTKSAFLPAEKGIQVKSTTVSVSNSRAVDNAPTTFDGNFKPLPAPEKPSQRPLASEVSNYSKTPTEGSNPTISKNSPKTKDSKSLQASSSASLTRKTITVSKKKLIPLDGPVPSNDGPVKEVPGVKSGPETAKPSVKNLSAKELKEPSGKESSLKNDPPKLLRTVAKDLQKVEKPSKDKLSAPKLEMSNADVAKETLVNDKLNLAAKEANIRADHLANKEDRKPRSKSVPPSVTRKDEVKGSKSTAPLKPEIKKPPEEEALKRQKSTSEPKGKTQKLEKLQLDEKAKRASIGDIKSTMGPGLSKVSSKKGDESLKSSKEKLTAGGTAKKTNDKSKTKPTQDLKPSGDNLANFSSNLIPSETVEVPPVNISSDSTTSLPIDLSETRLQRALRLRSKLKMDIDGCFAMGLSDPSDDLAKPAEETDAKIEPEIPVPKKPEPPPPVIKADVKTAASTTESLPSSLRISSPLPLERHPSARRKVIKNLGYPATGWTIETLNREEVPDKPRFYKFRRARSLEDVSRIYNWYRQTFPLPFGHYTNYNDVFRATKNDIVQDDIYKRYPADDHNFHPNYTSVMAESFGFDSSDPMLTKEDESFTREFQNRNDKRKHLDDDNTPLHRTSTSGNLPPISKSGNVNSTAAISKASYPNISENSVRYLQQYIERTKKQGREPPITVTLPRSRSSTMNPGIGVLSLEANNYPRRPAPPPAVHKKGIPVAARPASRSTVTPQTKPGRLNNIEEATERVVDWERYSDRIRKRNGVRDRPQQEQTIDDKEYMRDRSRNREYGLGKLSTHPMSPERIQKSSEKVARRESRRRNDAPEERQEVLQTPTSTSPGANKRFIPQQRPRSAILPRKSGGPKGKQVSESQRLKGVGNPSKKIEISAQQTQLPLVGMMPPFLQPSSFPQIPWLHQLGIGLNPQLQNPSLSAGFGLPDGSLQQASYMPQQPLQQVGSLPAYNQAMFQMHLQQLQQNHQAGDPSLLGMYAPQSHQMPILIPSNKPSVPPSLMPARIRLQNVPVVVMKQAMVIEATGEPAGTLGEGAGGETAPTAFIDAGFGGGMSGAYPISGVGYPFMGGSSGGIEATGFGIQGEFGGCYGFPNVPNAASSDLKNHSSTFGVNTVAGKAMPAAERAEKRNGVRSMIKKGVIGRRKPV